MICIGDDGLEITESAALLGVLLSMGFAGQSSWLAGVDKGRKWVG